MVVNLRFEPAGGSGGWARRGHGNDLLAAAWAWAGKGVSTGFVKLYHLNLTRSAPSMVADRRERLRDVLWLGGSACSGKSEVARRLAADLGIAVYEADASFERLRRHADPRLWPAFCRVGDLAPRDLWQPPAAAQAVELWEFHREHCELLVEELLGDGADGEDGGDGAGGRGGADGEDGREEGDGGPAEADRWPPGGQACGAAHLLVEGACLLPEPLAGLITSRRQALWLVATPEFRRHHYRRRGRWVNDLLDDCADVDGALERWMERDDLMAERRLEEAARLGLECWRVDGGASVAEMAAAAAAHFGLAGVA